MVVFPLLVDDTMRYTPLKLMVLERSFRERGWEAAGTDGADGGGSTGRGPLKTGSRHAEIDSFGGGEGEVCREACWSGDDGVRGRDLGGVAMSDVWRVEGFHAL